MEKRVWDAILPQNMCIRKCLYFPATRLVFYIFFVQDIPFPIWTIIKSGVNFRINTPSFPLSERTQEGQTALKKRPKRKMAKKKEQKEIFLGARFVCAGRDEKCFDFLRKSAKNTFLWASRFSFSFMTSSSMFS